MANYLLDQTGAEVQAILDAVQNPDTTPVQGSSNLITSGGVQAAIAGSAAEIGEEVSALGQKVDDSDKDISISLGNLRLEELADAQVVKFEQGAVNSTGYDSTSAYRIRTIGAIPTNIGLIAVPDGFLIHEVHYYSSWKSNSDFTFISPYKSVAAQYFTPDTTYPLCRITIRRSNSGVISPEDITALFHLVYPFIKEVDDATKKTRESALLVKSINLFDGEYLKGFYLSSTGVFSANSNFRTVKNAIPVTVGQDLYFSYDNNGVRKTIGGNYQEFSDIEGNTPIIRATNLSGYHYECTDPSVKSIRPGFRIDQLGLDPDTMEYMVCDNNSVYVKMTKAKASDVYAPYFPYGYIPQLDSRKNTILTNLRGKKIACFGDSLTMFGFYPELAGLLSGADVENFGVGGTRLTTDTGAWGAFTATALADAIASGDWSAQEDALPTILNTYDITDMFARLESVDWTKMDMICFSFGTNDYNNTARIEGAPDSLDPSTYRGAINYIVQKISVAYPNIRVIFISPMYRVYPKGHGESMTTEEYQASSYTDANFTDSDNWENLAGLTLREIATIIKEQANLNHCACLNMYDDFGLNKYTYLKYLSDGTHLTYDGYREYGRRLAGFLLSD